MCEKSLVPQFSASKKLKNNFDVTKELFSLHIKSRGREMGRLYCVKFSDVR